MPSKIVLTGATGKIGGAVLRAILEYDLASPSDLVIATSSDPENPKLNPFKSAGITVRQSNYDSVESMVKAFEGCERLFLVSTPHINLDFHDCAKGGREKHHLNALEAAKQAGISHVYYTSLAFQEPSRAGVMRAHIVTENFLKSQRDFDYTILREGLYNESWPLYLGHFQVPTDSRDTVVIGHDGRINWTSISDLGLASAMIVTGDKQNWAGKSLWLSGKTTRKLAEVAAMVGEVRGKPLRVEEVSQEEYIRHYTEDRKMDYGMIEWWSSTYLALQDNECNIQKSPLEDILATKGRKPESILTTIQRMLK